MANIYDVLRDKAKSMGHAAASLPDSAWQDYMQKQDKKATLTEAKLYMEQYMMGDLSPADFARVMVENDQLRYTISDLCRMRLEPANLNIQRNNDYIDLAAGIKTFWSEIHVPLPSEMSAARDMQHINLGIQAAQKGGVRTQGQNAGQSSVIVTEVPQEKTSLGGRIRQAREFAANKAVGLAEKTIEKLKPYTTEQAEETNKGQATAQKFDESWFETEDGRIYKNVYTQKAAQNIEGITMTVEAAKTGGLEPSQRKKALQAAGLTDDVIQAQIGEEAEETLAAAAKKPALRSGYTPEELNQPLDDQMKELFDQIAKHMGQDQKKAEETAKKQEMGAAQETGEISRSRKFDRIYGMYEGQKVSFKGSAYGHEFTDEEAKKLLSGEQISFTYADKYGNQKYMAGKLEWGEYKDKPVLSFQKDVEKIKAMESDAALRMKAPENDDPKEWAQGAHMGEGDFEITRQGNRIRGVYEEYCRSIKNSWGGHEFTDEEAKKLFAGEKISFEYVDSNGVARTASGGLEWQKIEGTDRTFLGFKSDLTKMIDVPPEAEKKSLAADDDLMAYYTKQAEAAQDFEEKVEEIPIEYPDEMALQ